MATELYVYYRAPVAAAPAIRSAVRQAQRHLCREHVGLQARLLRRPPGSAGHDTWMEIYRWREAAGPNRGPSAAPGDAAADPVATLALTIEAQLASALAGLGAGERHVERFEPEFSVEPAVSMAGPGQAAGD